MKIYLLPFMLVLSLFLIGCGGSSSFDDRNSEDEELNEELTSTFVLNDSLSQETTIFTQDESLHLVLNLTNNTNEEIVLEFNSGQIYDFFIKNNDDIEIWRWSDNQLFTQQISELRIPVGDTIEFKESWDQTLLDGSPLAIGNYTICGFVIGQTENCSSLTIQ